MVSPLLIGRVVRFQRKRVFHYSCSYLANSRYASQLTQIVRAFLFQRQRNMPFNSQTPFHLAVAKAWWFLQAACLETGNKQQDSANKKLTPASCIGGLAKFFRRLLLPAKAPSNSHLPNFCRSFSKVFQMHHQALWVCTTRGRDTPCCLLDKSKMETS